MVANVTLAAQSISALSQFGRNSIAALDRGTKTFSATASTMLIELEFSLAAIPMNIQSAA